MGPSWSLAPAPIKKAAFQECGCFRFQAGTGSGFECLDPRRQARQGPRRLVAVHDPFLRAAHDLGLGILEGVLGRRRITALDGLLDILDRGPHRADTVSIDEGLTRRTPDAFLCRPDIGH